MANADQSGKNDQVGLFLRAMVDREPGKRKVKPSKSALIDLAELDFGESSDDSDFNVDEAKLKEDDDISICSDPDEDIADSESAEDDEDEANEIASFTKKDGLSVRELLEAAEKNCFNGNVDALRPKILVCAICLGDYSDDTNEIVICDGCNVSVHEGCYGISDTISLSSTVSSSSTEPWFCDSCKAGVPNPPCELCPNLGETIFKETETGKWTHLVCALYVPGVAFSEVDKLSFPTLFEMPYSRFGAKACSLCEDERYSKTGVCIGCDAGMCRSYFHVTCAQREGLLSEVNHGEFDQADPYYAHCKMHSDKEQIRRRKRNWLSLQLSMKQAAKEKLEESQHVQDRLQRKLQKYKEKYLFTKANRPTPWFPTQKMPRSLSTSAIFFRSILRKTELMGVQTEHDTIASVGEIRKKWHISPAFSVEYISYYIDRVARIQELKNNLDFLLGDNKRLVKEESDLREKYGPLDCANNVVKDGTGKMLAEALWLHDMLKKLAERPIRLPPIVALLHEPVVASAPADKAAGAGRIMTKAAAKMLTDTVPVGCSDLSLNRGNCGLNLKLCHVCQLNKDQHLMIQCDTCTNFYHLNCLDPPLTRMPKKTKQMGWQCSDCCKSSDSDRTPEIDTAAPRKLRRIIKEPAKFSPSVPGDCRRVTEAALSPLDSESAKSNLNDILEVTPLKQPAAAKGTPRKPLGPTKRKASRDRSRGKAKLMRRNRSDSNALKSDSNPPKSDPNPPKSDPNPPKSGLGPVRGRAKQAVAATAAKPETITAQLRKLQNIVRQPTVSLVPVDPPAAVVTHKPDNVEPKSSPAKDAVPKGTGRRAAAKLEEKRSDPTSDKAVAALKAVGTKGHSTVDPSAKAGETADKDDDVIVAQKSKAPADKESALESPALVVLDGPAVAEESTTERVPPNSESNCGNTGGEQTESAQSTTTSSLPSPPTESVPSDDALSTRKEKRHREKKKKKKDKDKESDVPRKKKKHHHRDKPHLSEMASEIVPPFRLKIKPMPPRPAEIEPVIARPASTYTEAIASRTTTTTTAPPGYPPLPPGYTLTQPVPVSTSICDSLNSSKKESFQLPYVTVGRTSHSTTAVMTNSQKPTVGRRKSDTAAEQFSNCDVCGEMGGVTNTVACDECQKAYHFNCLDPPLKKSPKRRGYSWFCEDCDSGPTAPPL